MTDSSDVTPLLISEATEADLFRTYEKYTATTNVKAWKVLDILSKVLEQYNIQDAVTDLGYIKHTLGRFAKAYTSSNAELKTKMDVIAARAEKVLDSDAAEVLVQKKKQAQKKYVYQAKLQTDVYQDKTYISGKARLGKRQGSPSVKAPNGQPKRGRRLNPADFAHMTVSQQIHRLCIAYSTNTECNRLNLSENDFFPKRFAKIIDQLQKSLAKPLRFALKTKEQAYLLQLSNCKNLGDVESLIKSIPLVTGSGIEKFLFLALSKLTVLWQSSQLYTTDHNEGWYQIHVYGDVLDCIFLSDGQYQTKRTECHASAIKYLKKMRKVGSAEKEVKVDLLLFNNQYGDLFACEDKPASTPDNSVKADIKKSQKLSEKRLMHIQSVLPYNSLISKIEVLSAQFHGLELTVHGARMTNDGDFVHYEKCKAAVPANSNGHFSETAIFLATVISLQRSILLELEKLEVMCEVAYADAIQYLESTPDAQKLQYREDTPDSTASSSKSTHGSNDDWRPIVREQRIVEAATRRLKEIDFGEDVLTAENWEDIICAKS
ncbi:hypothetical protein BJV82DRAFT_348631 [Fennellomyces sp. T-0311]|nr:hypothetical protein BJV82DRAFT_348631 [Fennellomyces sp. T-0311]